MAELLNIKSNAKIVAHAIKGLAADIANFAIEREKQIRTSAERGIDSHFDKLGWGGSDSTALGGSVTWEAMARAWQTRAEHAAFKSGGGTLPLLQLTGEMRNDYTAMASSASGQVPKTAGFDGSTFFFFSTNPMSVEKATKHHEGGFWPASFERIGWEGTMEFWERPFLYWDSKMASEIRESLTVEYYNNRLSKWINIVNAFTALEESLK